MRKTFSPIVNRSRQRGVTLIEVLVAILVFAIGMLGLAALQARAIANVDSSQQRTHAVLLTYFILDAMRADRDNALAAAYNQGVTCIVPAGGSTIAQNARRDWIQAIKNTLGDNPDNCGEVECDNAGICIVRIHFDDSRGTHGAGHQIIETRTRL